MRIMNLSTQHILEAQWFPWQQADAGQLSAQQLDWLSHSHSLTQRLREVTHGGIELTLIHAGYGTDEHGQPAWLRKIHWQYQSEIWVIGDVVIPPASLEGPGAVLLEVGANSIGDTLKTDPNLRRGPIEISQLSENTWARRSSLFFHQQPLTVCETFLPAFFASELIAAE